MLKNSDFHYNMSNDQECQTRVLCLDHHEHVTSFRQNYLSPLLYDVSTERSAAISRNITVLSERSCDVYTLLCPLELAALVVNQCTVCKPFCHRSTSEFKVSIIVHNRNHFLYRRTYRVRTREANYTSPVALVTN
jgi:hypothetical protein